MEPLNGDDLVKDYLTGRSMKQLARQHGVSTRTVRKILRTCGVQLRTGSETAKRFNRGPAGPRVLVPPDVVREMVNRYLAGDTPDVIADQIGFGRAIVYRELKARGVLRNVSEAHRFRLGNLSAEERMRITAAAHAANRGRKQTPENLARSAATRQRRLTFTSPNEIALKEALRSVGYDISPQCAVGRYNLDIALESRGIAMEVESSDWACFLAMPRRQRHEHLLGAGWCLLYILDANRGLVFPDVLQKVVTFLEVTGRDKAFRGHYGVIWRDGKRHAGSSRNPDNFPRVPGF